MPRVSEITNAEATAEQRAILDAEEQAGGVYNTTRVWLHRAGALAGLKAFSQALEADRTLPAGLVHLTRVRIAQINGCPF
jgi:alkylhydroperoxidase family enzyme